MAMNNPAIVRRRLQFEAGPEQTDFYACAEHADKLAVGRVDVSCFFGVASALPEPVDPEDEEPCWFCQEG